MGVVDIIACKGEPFGDLMVYPFKMRDYEILQENKLCLTIMRKKLGVKYLQIPYLRVLAMFSTEELNLLGMLYKLVATACHIQETQIQLTVDKETGKVSLFIISDGENPEIIETISELRFMKFRELIAKQNNIKLPDELANIEIMESEEVLLASNSMNLDVNFESLFFSVATYCGFSAEAMLDMTVFEFEERISAISRIEKYKMYGQSEMSGMVSFKGGNPYPSWCFDQKNDGLHGAVPLGQFQNKMSVVANTI